MIINLDEIDSTNEYLKRMSNDGYNSDEMLVVTAQYQTAGKGRRGNVPSCRQTMDISMILYYTSRQKSRRLLDSIPRIVPILGTCRGIRNGFRPYD